MALALIVYGCGGALLTNAIPHGVSGMLGRPFPSPFASPPGKGLSSPMVNVLWAAANLALAWVLLTRVGVFDLRRPDHAAAFGLGMLLIGLQLAHHFGSLHQP